MSSQPVQDDKTDLAGQEKRADTLSEENIDSANDREVGVGEDIQDRPTR